MTMENVVYATANCLIYTSININLKETNKLSGIVLTDTALYSVMFNAIFIRKFIVFCAFICYSLSYWFIATINISRRLSGAKFIEFEKVL